MLNAKKIIAALALALMATAVGVAPAEAGNEKPTNARVGGGWCC